MAAPRSRNRGDCSHGPQSPSAALPQPPRSKEGLIPFTDRPTLTGDTRVVERVDGSAPPIVIEEVNTFAWQPSTER